VPQGGGDYRAAWNFALHPTVFEETADKKISGDFGSGEDGGDAAADALVEGAPGEVEIWAFTGFEAHRCGRLGGLLS
jgi:hypothetical protein